MVLGGRPPGRVGRRRNFSRTTPSSSLGSKTGSLHLRADLESKDCLASSRAVAGGALSSKAMSPEETGAARRKGVARNMAKRGGAAAGTGRQRPERSGPAEEVGRYRSRRERNLELPGEVLEELRQLAGPRGRLVEHRLLQAAQAYERDRYEEALRLLRPVVDEVRESPAVMELYGLTLYRLGRWRQAAKVLRQVSEKTDSYDQYPVIADCERAQGRPSKVREIWEILRHEGVSREVLVEGRLVMAGALADQGDLEEAIALLAPSGRPRRHADLPMLREWYALADLYEAAGDLARARELFARVAAEAPDLLDAPARLRAIR